MAVRGANLYLLHLSERLGESERPGEFGIVEVLLDVAVGAAAVRVDSRRQEQTLAQRQEFLLREEGEILDALPLLEYPHVCACPDYSESSDKIAAHDARNAEIPTRPVHADRCSRREGAAQRREREHSARAQVEIHIVAVAEERRTRLAIVDRLELQLGWKEKRILLRELIGSSVQHQLEIVGLPLDRIERQPTSQDRAQHLLVVLHQCRCLQRVADVAETIRWIGSVWILAQVEKARREWENHPEAHARVVVVGETALGE